MRTVILLIISILLCTVAYAGTITPNGMAQGDLYQLYKDMVYAANNRNFADAGLAIDGGAKAKFITGASTVVSCSGVPNAFASTSALVFTAPLQTIPAGKRAIFTVAVDAADAVTTKQSQVVTYDHQLVIPVPDEGKAIIGIIKVVGVSGVGFVPNTTLLDAAAVTTTYTDLLSLPISLDTKAR